QMITGGQRKRSFFPWNRFDYAGSYQDSGYICLVACYYGLQDEIRTRYRGSYGSASRISTPVPAMLSNVQAEGAARNLVEFLDLINGVEDFRAVHCFDVINATL